MKTELVAVAVVLSLSLAVPAFAIDGSQTPAGAGPNLEQIKDFQMKRLDARINSLQEEKSCVQAAKSREDLKVCNSKAKTDEHGIRRGTGGPVLPQVK